MLSMSAACCKYWSFNLQLGGSEFIHAYIYVSLKWQI